MGKIKPTATAYPAEDVILESAPSATDEEVILTFDLSTTKLGWALGVDRDLVMYGKYVFKGTASLGEKLLAFDGFLTTLFDAYKPTTIVVEEPVMRKATIRHFEVLGVLRRAWTAYRGEDIPEDNSISVNTIKKQMHMPQGKEIDNKAEMVKKMNTMYGLKLQYFGRRNQKSDDDIADAIAVLATYWRLHVN